MICKKCNFKMLKIDEDEGGCIVYWCYKCGSLGLGMIGEPEGHFCPTGDKPKWADDNLIDTEYEE